MNGRRLLKLKPKVKARLEDITRNGITVLKARALLLSEDTAQGPPLKDREIRVALGISERTIQRSKKDLEDHGLEEALGIVPEPRPAKEEEKAVRKGKFDGDLESRIVVMCNWAPADGGRRWTLKLLADKAVELGLADEISIMSIQRILKKNRISLRKKRKAPPK
jgi:transposase